MPLERWSAARTAARLRAPGPADDKYRRGVLGMRTGSADYPGAAVLGVTAAWRAGVGMLRYVPPTEGSGGAPSASDAPPRGAGLPDPAAAVLAVRPETVFGEPGGRPCDAWLIGSGTDPASRSAAETAALRELLRGDAPVVVDAGALGLAAEAAGARGGEGSLPPGPAAPMILTPHRGEFERLWETCGLGGLPVGWPRREDSAAADAEVLAEGASRLAARLGATVLLKGSTTIAAAPTGDAAAVGPATPWLATAGTGDVLAGALGALVACDAEAVRRDPSLLRDLGAAAAQLHDTAARIASGDSGSDDCGAGSCGDGAGVGAGVGGAAEAAHRGRPITALDVAEALPLAFARLSASGDRTD